MRISNRPSTYRKRPPDLDRYTCSMALNIVARKVLETDSIRTEDRSGDTTAAATGHLSNDENGSPTGFLAGGCGRPKGSTINSKRGANQRKAMAIFKAARVYKERLEQRRNNNASSRLMNGKLSTIIDNAKALYNVDGNVTIHASTI